jgi:hypothetical protein
MDAPPGSESESAAMVAALRRLAAAHEGVAQSLGRLGDLLAEEMGRRAAERQACAAAREEIVRRYEQAKAPAQEDRTGPRLPWYFPAVWILLVLTLGLAVACLAIYVFFQLRAGLF